MGSRKAIFVHALPTNRPWGSTGNRRQSDVTASQLFSALRSLFRLRHHEDLLRLRILHFAPRRIAADIDISSVRLERIEHEPGFTRHWLRHRKLCCTRRRRSLCRTGTRCRPCRSLTRFSRGSARGRSWRRRRQRTSRVGYIRRGLSRRRLGRMKNVPHHAASSQRDWNHRRDRDCQGAASHRAFISRLWFNATNR